MSVTVLKLAPLLLTFFLVLQPAFAQAQGLTLNRIKSLLVEAGFKDARVEDSLVLVDGLGRFDSQAAVGLAEDKSTFMISTNWDIPAEKQKAIPALKMLTANSYGYFVFALVGDEGELSLNIEATYDSSLISKTMLRKAIEQFVETVDGNEEIWNTDKWVAEGKGAKPEPAKPAVAKPQPPAALAQSVAAAVAAVARPLAMPRLLFASRKANGFGDVAPRPSAAFPQGDTLLVYLEAAGLSVAPGEGGKNRVGIAVDYEVRTWARQSVYARKTDLDQTVPVEGAEQPPLYVTSAMAFRDLAPGSYVLTFYLRDTLNGRTTQGDLPFTVVPAAAPRAETPAAAAPAVPPASAPPPVAAIPPAAPKPAPRPAAPPAKPVISALGSDGLLALGLRAGRDGKIYAAPRIEVRGTAMSADDLAKLLDPATAAKPWERLVAITAREITVPEIRIETAADLGAETVVLRDVRVIDVAQGRFGSVTVGGGDFSKPGEVGGKIGSFTRLDVAALDLALLASLEEPAKEAAGEAKPVYRSFAIEGLSIPGVAPGDVTRIARIASRDVRVRPLAQGWRGFGQQIKPLGDDDAPAQTRIAALAPMADLLDAFEPGSLDVTGIEVVTSVPTASSVRIARMGFTTDRDGPGEVRADGLTVVSPEGQVRLSSFAVEGISLRSAIAGMRTVASQGSTELGPADIRRLVPQIRAIRFGGTDVDVTQDGDGPLRFSIGAVELETADPVDGVPTGLRFAINNFVAPIAAAQSLDATGQVGALGYTTLGLTGRLDLGWNEAARQVVLKELSIDGAGMGTVTARGVVANVSKDVFSPNPSLATVAALGTAIESLDIDIEDHGLLQRALAAKAAQGGGTVDSARTEVAAMATLGVPALLGDAPDGKTLGQALGRFIAAPGRLHIGIKAKQPPGLGIADFQTVSNPAAFFDKVQVVAEPR
ncbi:hypothetical protein [Methylobacterium haplocladii]|uniref:Uncharacterized protein n=3 Tax=Methylobacterium haplocladii TaxID=1176176 RepID=A0A512ILJ4_9HYPH|nr:hypothetical protein [Methylobacterium haplocladii]GEO98512.1 hypothetical protein MHA02_09000 [Methylobacterium haplocladii]GJD82817.1 hypothetical protein HPGCJGGD_0678 [Methylobacterium haplocladii]